MTLRRLTHSRACHSGLCSASDARVPCVASQRHASLSAAFAFNRRCLVPSTGILSARFVAAAADQALVVDPVEPSSTEAPTEDAAATAAAPEPSTAEATPRSPGEAAFLGSWQTYMTTLKANGIFTEFDESGMRLSEAGAIKKAAIECGRRRGEALYDLSEGPLKAFVSAHPGDDATGALKDRKCYNAIKRLSASYVDQSDLDIGAGGAASFTDVCRVLWGVSMAVQGSEANIPQDMIAHGSTLLEEIVGVIGREPSEASLKKAAAAEEQRRQQEQLAAAAREERRAQRLDSRGFSDRREPRFGSSFGSRGDDRSNFRPGDWSCTDCGAHNFARNDECFKCQAVKPEGAGGGFDRAPRDGGRFSDRAPRDSYGRDSRGSYGRDSSRPPRDARPGDWSCPDCSAHNFARNTSCFKCDAPKPAGAAATIPSQRGSVGDWSCSDCGGFNFARRTECYKCGADKATAGSSAFSSPGRGPGGFRDRSGPPRIVRDGPRNSRSNVEWKAGDWECPSCTAHNFSSKEACYRCGVPKPGGGGGGGSRVGGGGGRGSSYGWSSRGSDSSFSERSYAGGADADLDW